MEEDAFQRNHTWLFWPIILHACILRCHDMYRFSIMSQVVIVWMFAIVVCRSKIPRVASFNGCTEITVNYFNVFHWIRQQQSTANSDGESFCGTNSLSTHRKCWCLTRQLLNYSFEFVNFGFTINAARPLVTFVIKQFHFRWHFSIWFTFIQINFCLHGHGMA